MNEEEKKALRHIKVNLYDEKKQHKHIYNYILGLYDNSSIEIILQLIEKQQKEIENYQILKDDIEGHRIFYVDTPEFEEKYISKDKIMKKIDLIDKEYAEIIEKNKNDLYLVNINAQRHSAMQSILEELLGE